MNSPPPSAEVVDVRRLDRRLALVTGDQPRSIGFDELALRQDAECAVDLHEQAGDGRLSGSRVADEDQVLRDVERAQALGGAQTIGAQHVRLPPDLDLHALETGERIELGEQVGERLRRGRFRRRDGRSTCSCGRGSGRSGRRYRLRAEHRIDVHIGRSRRARDTGRVQLGRRRHGSPPDDVEIRFAQRARGTCDVGERVRVRDRRAVLRLRPGE